MKADLGASDNGMRTLGAVRGGDTKKPDDDAGGRIERIGAENEVAWTAPGCVAGATDTVHDRRGKGCMLETLWTARDGVPRGARAITPADE